MGRGLAFAEPELFRLMYDLNQAAAPSTDSLREARKQAFDVVRRIAAEAVDAGLLEGDPNLVAHLAWISAHGVALLASTGQLELGLELEDLVEPLIEQFIGHHRPKKGEPS